MATLYETEERWNQEEMQYDLFLGPHYAYSIHALGG